MEQTLVVIKPDAVAASATGEIIDIFLNQGFRLIALKTMRLTQNQAELFYQDHRGKTFFTGLIEFMVSGPVIPMVLAKDHAIMDARKLIGVTDSKQAAPGTIRALFGTDNRHNAVHGSDAQESALREIGFFFSTAELTLE